MGEKWKRKNGAWRLYSGGRAAKVEAIPEGFKLSIQDKTGAWREIRENSLPWKSRTSARSRGELELRAK